MKGEAQWIQDARAGVYDDLMNDKSITQNAKDHLKHLYDKAIDRGSTIKQAKEYAMLKRLHHLTHSDNDTELHDWQKALDDKDK